MLRQTLIQHIDELIYLITLTSEQQSMRSPHFLPLPTPVYFLDGIAFDLKALLFSLLNPVLRSASIDAEITTSYNNEIFPLRVVLLELVTHPPFILLPHFAAFHLVHPLPLLSILRQVNSLLTGRAVVEMLRLAL